MVSKVRLNSFFLRDVILRRLLTVRADQVIRRREEIAVRGQDEE